MQVYGNLTNRLEEGKMYVPEIKEGTDITMYSWSDRNCYYVAKVINEKDILVLPYHVCADHEKPGGMGHQDWMYFKTAREHNEYLKRFYPDWEFNNEQEEIPQEWIFTRNQWKLARRHSPEVIEEKCDQEGWSIEKYAEAYGFTKTDLKKALAGKEVIKYYNLSGKVSFGIRDCYYDWEF